MEVSPKKCTALNVSDGLHCQEAVTSINGLFCSFHSRQCQGLYLGYKIRNAHLNALDDKQPAYLANHPQSIANNEFKDVQDEQNLQEIHAFLHEKFSLLDRVIRARKLHHSRFFSSTLDYGHQNYLDQLSSQRYVVLRAMERLERRLAEMKLDQRRYFQWIRAMQDTEEARRESEKKKIKLEAAIFKRHEKEMKMKLSLFKAREDQKRQEAALDEAYEERLSKQAREELEAGWDPIEDVIENDRQMYMDLIRLFLSMEEGPSTRTKDQAGQNASGGNEKLGFETADQIRTRLAEVAEIKPGFSAPFIASTLFDSTEPKGKMAPLKDDEIDALLVQVREIKLLLLCRLILGHASVLRPAMEAENIEDFLENRDVAASDLRDLVLKLENPGKQEIRDACADLERSESEVQDHDLEDEDERQPKTGRETFNGRKLLYRTRTGPQREERWSSKREKEMKKHKHGRDIPEQLKGAFADTAEPNLIDFGPVDDSNNRNSKKMAITVCGRRIFNYPSEQAVSRGGWLQFSILARNSRLDTAIELCRNWEEFWELNIVRG